MATKHYDAATYKARTSIGYLVKRAHALMLDNVEPAFAEQDFTFMQWIILMYLRDGIALNPKDICGEFRHDSGALTRVIDNLEQRGLVKRSRSKTDRRTVELELTRSGKTTVEKLIPVVVTKLNEALAGFSRDEVTELTRLLLKLITSMQPQEVTGAAA